MNIKSFEFNLFGVNTYVVWDRVTSRAAIVDPGMTGDADNAVIDMFIADNSLEVTHLLFTHLHIDHTLGTEHVIERYGVKVEANPSDAFLGLQRDMQAGMFHLRQFPGPMEIAVELHHGDVISFGNESLEVLSIPGHSPGSVVFYNRAGGWVITGDVLFRGSIGRTDLLGGNHAELLNGIRSELITLPPATVVYPGHGPKTTIGDEIKNNQFIR